MKKKVLLFTALIIAACTAYAGVVYYGAGRAVFLENIIQFANFFEIEATGIKNLRVGGELAAHNIQAANVDKNFIPIGAFETSDEDFTSYVDAAGVAPVDGTGGGASSFLTCAQSSTTPLEGNGSLNMVKFNVASGGQGHGCSYDFTIPALIAGKTLSLSFKKHWTDADSSDGDFAVFIYDITNANLISPTTTAINESTTIETFNTTFTSSATSTSYRVIFHLTQSRTGVFTLQVDNLFIGEYARNALTNPMTTQGDLISGGTSGTPERLAIGAAGSLLRSNGTTAAWTTDFSVNSNRIKADFSNGTFTNRMSFQTSTTNGPTSIAALPNGTGTFGGFQGYTQSDPTNSPFINVYNNGAESGISSDRRGSGTYLPLTFGTGGTERMRIDSSGNVTIATLAGTGSRAVNADASGTLSAASDSRLKQEVEAPIPGLNEILQLQPKAYKWLADIEKRGENAATEIGFFADQVANIIPSAAPLGNDGYYGFYDRSVTAALVKAIQELSAKNDEKDAQISSLQSENQALQSSLNALIARIEALEAR